MLRGIIFISIIILTGGTIYTKIKNISKTSKTNMEDNNIKSDYEENDIDHLDGYTNEDEYCGNCVHCRYFHEDNIKGYCFGMCDIQNDEMLQDDSCESFEPKDI